MTITVYSKPSCVQCDATYRALAKRGLPYTQVDMSQDEKALEYVKALGHQQAPVVFVEHEDGRVEHFSGYRPDLLKALAAQAPAPMLAAA